MDTITLVYAATTTQVLIHVLTKKVVFRFPVNEVQPPRNPLPTVNADQFWCDVEKEIIARGMIYIYAMVRLTLLS